MKWDLDDIAAVSDLAAAFGVSKPTVSNWLARHPDFPKPLTTVAQGHSHLFSLREVTVWHENHDWKPGRPRKKAR